MTTNIHDAEAKRLGPELTSALDRYIEAGRREGERFEQSMQRCPDLRRFYEQACREQGVEPYE